jgi:hypothetical protein
MKKHLIKIKLETGQCMFLDHLFTSPGEGAEFAVMMFMSYYNALIDGVVGQFNENDMEVLVDFFRGKTLNEIGFWVKPELDDFVMNHYNTNINERTRILRKLNMLTYMEMIVLQIYGYSQWNDERLRGR